MEREYRTLKTAIEIRAKHGDEDMEEEEKSTELVGYAARYDSLSEDLGGFREKIAPGAFDSVLANNPDVRALVDHDSSRILGRTIAGTLRLSADTKGLRAEIDPPDTTVGRDTLTSIERGDLDAMSFGFVIDRDGEAWDFPEEGPAIRTITNVRDLFDVSVVTYPAYRATDVAIAQRNMEDAKKEKTESDESWRKELAEKKAAVQKKREDLGVQE